MLRANIVVLSLALLTSPALAQEAPKLPATAKKITGKEILALYEGKTLTNVGYTPWGVSTGKLTFNIKENSMVSEFKMGEKTGTATVKVRVKGDTFCWIAPNDKKERCHLVHVDTDGTIYETDDKKVVKTVNKI
jgi:hypothetical protein